MENTTVKIIGCGDAFGSGGRLHTCFYIRAGHTNVLLDCGATAYHGIKQQSINIHDIDMVVISHFHGDHYGGIPFLLLDEAIHQREKPLTIISPPTGKERIERLLGQLYPGTAVMDKLDIHFKTYLPGKAIHALGLDVQAWPVAHSPEALPHGVRINTGNKVIAYSGDTEWTPALIELSRNADLFLCECNFFELEVVGHMNYKTLQAHDDQLGYKRILLTHLGGEMLRNQSWIAHNCAEEGLEIVL